MGSQAEVAIPETTINKNPRVSVVILAYNHEAYIRQALEGVVMQKNNFKFEVYVHDDASHDGTSDIIQEYEKKYPSLIKPIFQKENQFSRGINPLTHHIYPQLKGDYIAYCEGDDYWSDPLKLQKQVDFMDSHPEYIVCGHDVHMQYEKGVSVKEVFYNKPSEGSFSFTFLDEFSNHFLATASVLVRRDVAIDTPVTNNLVSVDMHALLYFLSKGNGYYMVDKMAVKRRNLGGITMDLAYRRRSVDGQYRMWKEILVFAPERYKSLLRFRVAEYQRLLLKKRSLSPRNNYADLLLGAVRNNPFWFLGLGEKVRQLRLQCASR
ncbi:glycosyltransferase family 2 protein [Flagellimonas marinaquae]